MADNTRLEAAAASILQRAVGLDKNGRFTESLVCYQEGLQILVDLIKGLESGKKKDVFRTKIESYMGRAEQLKKHIEEQKDLGVYHELISIEDNSKGHSYETLIGRFLDEDVTYVKIEDPYIRTHNQCQNFLRFCELVVKKCEKLKKVFLLTGSDARNVNEQKSWLDTIKSSLSKHNITLEVEFSQTLHDRQIILGNGWIVKIGRGLDYFKPAEHKFSVGYFDYDLRQCHETKVDIFHSKDVKHSYG